MTKEETFNIITLLAGNYDSIMNKTKEQKKIMIDTWYECLGDLDYSLVKQAVKKTMTETKFIPTIAEVRQNAIEMITPQRKTGIEAWDDAYKIICRGTTVTQEEFDNLEPNLKKFFGSVSQIRGYATSTDINMDVVRSNFLKSYETLEQRNKEQEIMLPETRQRLQELQNMAIKQIGGGE